MISWFNSRFKIESQNHPASAPLLTEYFYASSITGVDWSHSVLPWGAAYVRFKWTRKFQKHEILSIWGSTKKVARLTWLIKDRRALPRNECGIQTSSKRPFQRGRNIKGKFASFNSNTRGKKRHSLNSRRRCVVNYGSDDERSERASFLPCPSLPFRWAPSVGKGIRVIKYVVRWFSTYAHEPKVTWTWWK